MEAKRLLGCVYSGSLEKATQGASPGGRYRPLMFGGAGAYRGLKPTSLSDSLKQQGSSACLASSRLAKSPSSAGDQREAFNLGSSSVYISHNCERLQITWSPYQLRPGQLPAPRGWCIVALSCLPHPKRHGCLLPTIQHHEPRGPSSLSRQSRPYLRSNILRPGHRLTLSHGQLPRASQRPHPKPMLTDVPSLNHSARISRQSEAA